MKLFIVHGILWLLALVSLTGCGGNIVDWAKGQMSQGCDVKQNLTQARCYVRADRIYDVFNLEGSFAVLWLSDPVLHTYATLRAHMQGTTPEQERVRLAQKHADDKRFISFYVLSACDMALGQKNSVWTLLLSVDGAWYQPYEITEIELPREYALIFGKYHNHFKIPYLVRFKANSHTGTPIITSTTSCIALHLRTFTKECAFEWGIPR
jgi:hypothetical protein